MEDLLRLLEGDVDVLRSVLRMGLGGVVCTEARTARSRPKEGAPTPRR
jgi:hypothetical protein